MKETVVIDYNIDNKKNGKIERKRTSDDNSKLRTRNSILRAYSLQTKLAMQIFKKECLPIGVINCPWYLLYEKEIKIKTF